MKLSRADVEWLLAAQLKDLQMVQSDDQFSASSLEYMLTQLHAGGVVMDAFQMHTFAQTRHARAKMHKHAAIPLRIAADEEGGYVERGQHLFGPHPGADEAATRVIALKLASHLIPGMPSQMCNSAEKGAIKKITAQNERDLHPLFPREAAQNSLGKGGKREKQKITAQNKRDLHPISCKSGNRPPCSIALSPTLCSMRGMAFLPLPPAPLYTDTQVECAAMCYK